MSQSDGWWVCRECGSPEYTGGLSEEDVHLLSCPRCGCDEWVYVTRPASSSPSPA